MNSEEQRSPAAAKYWSAAAAAREWSAFIREHAACAARSAAWTAEDGANEATKRAVTDCGRVPDARGRPGADAMGRVTGAIRRAADAMGAAADGYGRSSELYGEAATEAARSYRAFMRAGDAQYAGVMRQAAMRSRRGRRDAARQAASAAEMAASLRHDAGALEDCAAAWAACEGGRGKRAVDMRDLSRALTDMWEDAKRKRLESAMIAEKAAELERAVARARRIAASEAQEAADEAADGAAAAAAATAEGGGGRRGDPDAERAAAAWRRAAAAANRADAEHPLADDEGRTP